MRVWPGQPYPLGATWTGLGVNFAIYSSHATKVELCLFDSAHESRVTERIPLPEHADMVWHAYPPDIRPGQLYGYRVHGPSGGMIRCSAIPSEAARPTCHSQRVCWVSCGLV